jgi:hypothetical protein
LRKVNNSKKLKNKDKKKNRKDISQISKEEKYFDWQVFELLVACGLLDTDGGA